MNVATVISKLLGLLVICREEKLGAFPGLMKRSPPNLRRTLLTFLPVSLASAHTLRGFHTQNGANQAFVAYPLFPPNPKT